MPLSLKDQIRAEDTRVVAMRALYTTLTTTQIAKAAQIAHITPYEMERVLQLVKGKPAIPECKYCS